MIYYVLLFALCTLIIFIPLGLFFRIRLDKNRRDNCNFLVETTLKFIKNNLGFIRIVSGKIRSGKTTLASGIIHADELNLIEQINNDLAIVQEIILDVDWTSINHDIEEQYNITHDRFLCSKFILKKYNDVFIDKTYYNYLKETPYVALLEKYIYAYFRKLDNNFVMSNIGKYSYVTNTMAKPYSDNVIRLKEVVESNNLKVTNSKYSILRYSSILEDEKLLGDKNNINIQSNFNDDGSSMFLRLIGQLGNETIYYTTTAQNALRWCKSEREIATSIIYINNREVIGNLPFIVNFIKKRQSKNNKRMHKYANKHFKDPVELNNYLLNNNTFKQKNLKYKNKLNKIFSESYLKYGCVIYRKIDDIGKSLSEATGAINFDFVFPVKWCFGSIDTHYFSFLQDYLEGYKSSAYYDLNEGQITNSFVQAQSMLKKQVKKEDKKETKKQKETVENNK